jgi:hypothetical protein
MLFERAPDPHEEIFRAGHGQSAQADDEHAASPLNLFAAIDEDACRALINQNNTVGGKGLAAFSAR